MPQLSESFFTYFHWILAGGLLMLMWHKSFTYKQHFYLPTTTVLFGTLLYINAEISWLLAWLSFMVWWVAHKKNPWLLAAFSTVWLLTLSLIPNHSLLIFMVLISLILMFETWLYLSKKSEVMALLSLLFILGMTISINLAFTAWPLIGLVMIFMLVHMYTEVPKTTSETTDIDQWFSLVEQSKLNERQRIYRNIHDEVGASLLQMIYQLDGHEAQTQAKTVMQKIRQSVADTAHFSINMEALFEDLMAETQVRLTAASIKLETEQNITERTNLAPQLPATLTRMVRETISNIIRHANASEVHFKVNWQPENKLITLTDNGIGIKANAQQGRGLKSIESRAKQINASTEWKSNPTGGTVMQIRFNQDV